MNKNIFYVLAFLGLYFSSSAHASLQLDYDEVVRIFQSAKVESFSDTIISDHHDPTPIRVNLSVAEYQASDKTKGVFASHHGLDKVLDGGKREVKGGHALIESQMIFSHLDPKFDAPHYFYSMYYGPQHMSPLSF
ncbi:MAG: hypothetical protein BGO76_05645 [Caedibacter sp. 38-128]|nr:hypothetical protein [Holosporales bacterium]OJX03529.1 MAG: hypothetical protein BGO76_05645 [Caedibacter sp. 38-128]